MARHKQKVRFGMTEPTGKSRIGVTGLSVMGANLV